jgi:phosphatidylserine synthase 2
MRLAIWCSIGLPGVREFYQFLTDSLVKQMGTMSWMCLAVFLVETLIAIKFGQGMFPNVEHPPIIFWGWGIFFSVMLMWGVWWYGFHLPNRRQNNHNNKHKQQ